jgi:hypothetical protein
MFWFLCRPKSEPKSVQIFILTYSFLGFATIKCANMCTESGVFSRSIPESTEEHSVLLVASITNEAHLLHLDTLLWEPLPPPPHLRMGCGTAVSSDGRFFLVGGWERGYEGGVDILNLHTRLWTTLETRMAVLRSDSSAVVRGDELIVIGGYGLEFQDLTTVEVCDLKTQKWSFLPSMACARAWYGAALCGDNLIVLGGYQFGQSYLSTGEVYSFEKQLWSPFSMPLLHPRGWLGLAVENHVLFVVGGRNSRGPVVSMERFELNAGTWKMMPSVPASENSAGDCSASIGDGRLFVCFSDEAFVFDIESSKWTQLPTAPARVPDPTCFLVKLSVKL